MKKSPGATRIQRIGGSRFLPVILSVVLLEGCRRTPSSSTGPGGTHREPPVVSLEALDVGVSNVLWQARMTLSKQMNSGDAWGRYGQTLESADFLQEAEYCYREAASLEPRAARWHHLLGLRQLQDQPEMAMESLIQAVRGSSSTNDVSRLKLAQVWIERGRHGEATNLLNELIRVHPENAAARLELARARVGLGNLDGLEALLNPSLTNAYTAKAAHLLLAQILLRLGRAEEAGRHSIASAALSKPFDWPDPFLREVQRLRNDSRKVAEQANRMLLERRVNEAESMVASILAAHPQDPEGLLLMGRIRLVQRRLKDAVELLTSHVQLRPESANGWVQLGMSLYGQSQWTEASTAFEKAVALKPDFAEAHFNLGFARMRSGASVAAIHSFRESLRHRPGDSAAHAGIAECFWLQGDRAGAKHHAEEALRLDPNATKPRQLLARLKE